MVLTKIKPKTISSLRSVSTSPRLRFKKIRVTPTSSVVTVTFTMISPSFSCPSLPVRASFTSSSPRTVPFRNVAAWSTLIRWLTPSPPLEVRHPPRHQTNLLLGVNGELEIGALAGASTHRATAAPPFAAPLITSRPGWSRVASTTRSRSAPI
jgi:hypothetical protein